MANTASKPGTGSVGVGVAGTGVVTGVGAGVHVDVGLGVAGTGVGVVAGFVAKHVAHSGSGLHGSSLSVPASISCISV